MANCFDKKNFDQNTFDLWRNESNFSDIDLKNYFCSYISFKEVKSGILLAVGYMNSILGVFGILSAILTLRILYRNEAFSAVCFFYLRVISIFELINTSTIICYAFQYIAQSIFLKSYSLYLMQWLVLTMGNVFSTSADLIIIFLSIERGFALLTPLKFHHWEKGGLTISVISISLIISVVLYVPAPIGYQIILSNAGIYTVRPSESTIFQICDTIADIGGYVLAGGVVISSVFAMVGMCKAMKMRQSVFRRIHTETGSDRASAEQAELFRRNVQLCCLQLSQALPTAVNHIVNSTFRIYLATRDATAVSGYVAVTGGDTFQQAMAGLSWSYTYYWLFYLGHLTNDIAHCTHFYLYTAFCHTFRDEVKARLFSN